jgi:hypothetical protein
MTNTARTIIYVPGMKPKPPAADHRETLWRCLLEGVRRLEPELVPALSRHGDLFRLVSWASLFYDTTGELKLDLPGIDRLLKLPGPEEADRREALHWHKRLGRFVYLLSDAFPFLIDHVANPSLKATLQDTMRYFKNVESVATRIRSLLAEELAEARRAGRRILLIAHSLGSVIAYDTLWEMSWGLNSNVKVDTFMTLGSPLGLNFSRHRLLGAHHHGARRYPANIRRWWNLAAVGEMTALDRTFADDYKEMLKLGLVEEITDDNSLFTYFRGPEGLNVHKCYGYMVNERVAGAVARWWREDTAN